MDRTPNSSPISVASSSTRPGSPSAPSTGELGPAHDTALGLAQRPHPRLPLRHPDERLAVLKAHPDLAGKLAAAKHLPEVHRRAGRRRPRCPDRPRTRPFTELDAAYQEKFGFPFIVAVRDHDKPSILEAIEHRLANTRDNELDAACAQVERIALLRLKDMLP